MRSPGRILKLGKPKGTEKTRLKPGFDCSNDSRPWRSLLWMALVVHIFPPTKNSNRRNLEKSSFQEYSWVILIIPDIFPTHARSGPSYIFCKNPDLSPLYKIGLKQRNLIPALLNSKWVERERKEEKSRETKKMNSFSFPPTKLAFFFCIFAHFNWLEKFREKITQHRQLELSELLGLGFNLLYF